MENRTKQILWVQKHINTSIVPSKFYAKFGYTRRLRQTAEKDLKLIIEQIARENNTKERRKAKRILDRFKALINSQECETYWKSLEKAENDDKGRSSAYERLNTFCNLVNEEGRRRLDRDESDSSDSSSTTAYKESEAETIWYDEEVAEKHVNIDVLDEPIVTTTGSGRVLSIDDWASARKLVESYRETLPKTRRLYESLRPTWPYEQIVEYIPWGGDLRATENQISDGVNYFVRYDSITNGRDDDMTEFEHTSRNIMPLLDATDTRSIFSLPSLDYTGCQSLAVYLEQDELCSVDSSNVVQWGFTVIGRIIHIYSLCAYGRFFHLTITLAFQAPLPSSTTDICNIKLAYCAMLGFVEKLHETERNLCSLNSKCIEIACAGTKQKEAPEQWSAPPVIGTPLNSSKRVTSKQTKI
ncbi:6967_t:CDS:10 [Paraglomus occultum]|uniref:6967_t:CDS:1 n=1 Tax=Paraglomus occultum TaxID=144539 RepID=A0A9N9CHZ7_9GLOM|nr:6967_t:CDS:10 [Paraglomus occultum]